MSDRFGNIPIQPPESLPANPPLSPKQSKPSVRPSGSAGRPPVHKPRHSFRSILRLVTIFAIIIVCYSALGFIGVPYYIRTILPEDFHAKTTMVLVPTAVHFNPFTLHFTTGETRIFAPSGGPILAVDSLQADLAPLAVLRGNIVCKTLSIDNLTINVTRELDGTYNFQPLLGSAKTDNISDLVLSELPRFFSLNNISITNSKIVFNDRLAGKIHTVEKIRLELPTFANTSLKSEQYLRPHFSAIANGSPIELTGQASLGQAGEAQTMRLTVDIHDLDLPTYAGYLPFDLPMQCIKGSANGRIDLFLNPQKSQEEPLSIGFQMQTTGIELVNELKQINIVVPDARVAGRLLPVSRTLQLSEVALKEPTISSYAGAWRENHAAPAEKMKSPTTPYQLMVELLLVDNGVVRFFPTKDAPQPESVWKTVQLSVKNYQPGNQATAGQPAGSFSLTGEQEGTAASFSWQGNHSVQNNLTGRLHLFKMNGKELLRAIGDNHPFSTTDMQGSADLRGQLVLYTNKDAADGIHYKLVDTELTLDDFSILDNEQPILDAPVIKLSGLSLVDDTIDFGTIQLRNATARFTPGQMPKIYHQFTLPQYRLQALDYEGKVLFTPAKKSAVPFIFSEVSLKANELGSAPGIENNFSVAAKTPDGAVFKAQGMVALNPFSASLKTGFRELPIEDIWPFFSDSTIPADIHGILHGKGSLSLPMPRFDGELELGEVAGKGLQNTPFSWQKAVFSSVQYTAQPFHLGVASTSIAGAHFSWQITSEASSPLHHFSQFMKTYFPLAKQVSDTVPENIAAPVTIEEISFTAGTIDIEDRRLTPAWTAENVSFAGSIKNIYATAAAESQFSFTGRLADSPFSVVGTVAPFNSLENGSLHFSLDSLPLSSFSKQFAEKTALDISGAQVSLLLDDSWQEQQYVSEGKLSLKGLKPRAASSDLALPLALLSDSSGTVELPFIFTRSTPVAQTSLAEELYWQMEHLLVKGRVSPLLLAAGNFTDLIGNESIDFHPGESILTDSGQATLSRYAELLLAHPQAGLILSGGLDQEIDSQAMQQSLRAVEQQRVDRENEKLLQQWQEQNTLYQQKLTELQDRGADEKVFEQDIPPAVLNDFKPLSPRPVQIDDEMLLELAHKRIDTVYQYLTVENEVAPEQLSTVFPESLAGQAQGSGSGVTITLTAITQ